MVPCVSRHVERLHGGQTVCSTPAMGSAVQLTYTLVVYAATMSLLGPGAVRTPANTTQGITRLSRPCVLAPCRFGMMCAIYQPKGLLTSASRLALLLLGLEGPRVVAGVVNRPWHSLHRAQSTGKPANGWDLLDKLDTLRVLPAPPRTNRIVSRRL